MFSMHNVLRAATCLGLGFIAAACSDATGANAHAVSLSVVTKQPTTVVANRSPLAPSLDVVVSSGANSLTITKAQVVLGKIELEPGTSATTCSGTDGDGCPEVKLDPVLVDLPLDGTTKTDFGASIPAGTYRGVELKVFPVSSGDAGAATFLAAHPGFSGVSVHVEGTYNGQPFTYDGNVDAEIEMEFTTPLTLGSGSGSNLTMFIDVASWFKDSSGNVLDPSNGANASAIADQIRRSFHAFEDDNKDGVEDGR